MSLTRIYQASPLRVETSLRLDEKASHHLAHVLRAKVGDFITLFNGAGGEYRAVITLINKKGVEVQVTQFSEREVESSCDIILAQGIARGEKMDFIVQKAVELGVTKIYPLITERCNVRLDDQREAKRLQHWQSIAASACEQCGRNRVPEVAVPQAFKTWLQGAHAKLNFVLSPHVQDKLPPAQSKQGAIELVIGPEGGLSDQEVAATLQHGFLPLSLGPRVLRTETATVAALSVLQFAYGDGA